MSEGELFILSAPSGTGKTTLIRSLMAGAFAQFGGVVFSVSHTTRPARTGEVDGQDYHFVDHETFHEMIVAERFLEWEEVHNNYYGTARDEVEPRLADGLDVIMDIDVKGAERVLATYPEATGIFVMPPSFTDLERRLAGRQLDNPRDVDNRLAVSHWEIKRYELYDYVIINDDATRASEVLASIILARRHRCERMRAEAEEILTDFQVAFEQPNDDSSSQE